MTRTSYPIHPWKSAGDETGLRSADVRGRCFAPKGETPVIRVSSQRSGLSIILTVTNKGQMRWKIFDGAFDSGILIDQFAKQQRLSVWVIEITRRFRPTNGSLFRVDFR
jgi:hypothetical protein